LIKFDTRASAENFPGGATKKKNENWQKKYRKTALFSLFQGGKEATKKDRKIAKKG